MARLLLLAAGAMFAAGAFADEPQQPRAISNGGKPAIIGRGPLKPLPAVQAEQLKKLAEAQKVVAEAIKKVTGAQGKLLVADTEEKKKAARIEIEEAKRELKKAQEAVEAQMKTAEARQPRRIVVSAGGTWGFASYPQGGVKPVKAPDDPIERFLLLTPGGPLVVEAEITVEGKPFRQLRETIVDRMMAYADSDKDGKATWDEAIDDARFSFGRLQVINENNRMNYLKLYDANQNGIVEREEARRALGHFTHVDAFAISGYASPYYRRPVVLQANGRVATGGTGMIVDLMPILDTDQDRVLSEKEIAAAPERFKSRDADDNDLVYPQEIITNPAGNRAGGRIAQGYQTRGSLAVPIGPAAVAGQVYNAIKSRYQNAQGEVTIESFPLATEFFEELDHNKNGKFDADEVEGLNKADPHIVMSVDLGKEGKGALIKRVAIKAEGAEGRAEKDSAKLPGMVIKALVNQGSGNYPSSYDRVGESYLTRYDKDKNGYLDKTELTGASGRYMQTWDLNADGKVFPKEIVESYQQMREPQEKQIRATVSRVGNSLFQAVDQSGDGRLSLREMRTASEQIKPFDKNKDGQITAVEIPETIEVTFGIGYSYYQQGRPVQGGQNANPPKSDAPDWFTRMDRNGDGDLTLKEFLGDKEQFKKLDTNSDGFIEPKEAKAAEK